MNWIIECNYWKLSVDKSHVLILRSIVEGVGADRGILLSESGAQSGAVAVTRESNAHVTSVTNLRAVATDEIVLD